MVAKLGKDQFSSFLLRHLPKSSPKIHFLQDGAAQSLWGWSVGATPECKGDLGALKMQVSCWKSAWGQSLGAQ